MTSYCNAVQAQLLVYDTYRRTSDTVVLPVSCVNKGGSDGAYGAPVGTYFSLATQITIPPPPADAARAPPPIKTVLTEVVKPTPSPGCVRHYPTSALLTQCPWRDGATTAPHQYQCLPSLSLVARYIHVPPIYADHTVRATSRYGVRRQATGMPTALTSRR